MKTPHFFLACLLFIAAGCGKTRTCTCKVSEEGTTTTTMKISSSLFPIQIPSGEPTETPFDNEWESVSEFDKVSKGDMRAACPTLTEEEINETMVASSSGSIGISITTERVGERKKECKIVN